MKPKIPPTDEQLAARGLTREQYNKRNTLWHALLSAKSPAERARINAQPGGLDGLLLAGQVEMAIAEAEKDDGEQPREDLEFPPFIMQSEGAIFPAKLAKENERRLAEYRKRTGNKL